MRVTIELDPIAATAEIDKPGERPVVLRTMRDDAAGVEMDAGGFGVGVSVPEVTRPENELDRSAPVGERGMPDRSPAHGDAFPEPPQGQWNRMNAGSHSD